uniref:Uncharacterized protein n=1 Tax=Chrysotila carterae TaxID=13221 RepID=A0A7S4EUY2_CHRCT
MSARTRYFVEAARRCSSAAAAARAASARITSAAQMRTSIFGAHATRWSSSTSSAFSVLTMQQLTGAGHAWSKPTFMLRAAGAAMLVGAGATMHSESQTQASPATSQRLFCWGTLSPPEAAGAAVPRARKEAVVVDFFSERGLGLSQLSFGSAHAAALDATGGVWVWGTQAGPAPQKLQTASLGQIAQLASTSDCLYAVTKSGKVHAWRDLDAQLVARGAAEVTSEPVLGEIAKVEAESMAAGADHCLVISKEGEVYAFGSNSHGQLGLGKSASELARADAPTKLGPLPAKAVQVHAVR